MINQYLQQLSSSDARTRREAIIALGKSSDPAALAPLADIYREDPDPTLRELALKAGRYLRQQVGDAPKAPPPAPSVTPRTKETSERLRRQVEEDDDQLDSPTKPEPLNLPRKVVSPQEVARSKSYIDAALTQNERGDNGKAVKLLKQAIELNPDLVKDNYFLSVASGVTNRNGEDSIRFLLDKGELSSFARQSARDQVQKRKSKHLETSGESSWGGVGLESLLYFIINAVGVIIILLVIFQVMQNALQDPRILNELGMPADLRDTLTDFAGVGLTFIFLYGAFFGIFNLIGMFIYGGVVHLAAIFLFGGKGLYRHFMDKLLGFFNKRLLVYYGLFLVATVVTVAAGAPIIGACISIILAFFSLWMLFQQMQVTAKAYDFGALGGCLSNVTAGAFFVLLGVVFQLALGASLDAAMRNVMPVR